MAFFHHKNLGIFGSVIFYVPVSGTSIVLTGVTNVVLMWNVCVLTDTPSGVPTVTNVWLGSDYYY